MTQNGRNLLASVTAAVVAVVFVVVRRMFDLGAAPTLIVLAVLTALLIYRLKHRSPYRSDENQQFKLK